MQHVQSNMATDLSNRINNVDSRQVETGRAARVQPKSVETGDTVDISKEARLAAQNQQAQTKPMPKVESVKKSGGNQNAAVVDKPAAATKAMKTTSGVRMVLATGTFLRPGEKTTVNYLG